MTRTTRLLSIGLVTLSMATAAPVVTRADVVYGPCIPGPYPAPFPCMPRPMPGPDYRDVRIRQLENELRETQAELSRMHRENRWLRSLLDRSSNGRRFDLPDGRRFDDRSFPDDRR